MDPSEFEGTVERKADVINAGVLEDILSTPDLPKFQSFDLIKESQDIYLAIFNLQDLIKQKEKTDSKNEERLQELEESSQKLIEFKEEYLTRRNKLKHDVKQFLSILPHLQNAEESPINVNEENYLTLSKQSQEMVDMFKKEYDNLSTMNKFIESVCLKSIKYYQEIPDYNNVIQDALKICMKSQDLVKNAQEQLSYAEKIVHTLQPPAGAGPDVPVPSLADIINALSNEKIMSSFHSSLGNHSEHNGSHLNPSHSSANFSQLNSGPGTAGHGGNNNSNHNTTNNNNNHNNNNISHEKHEKEKNEIREYFQLEINSLRNKFEMENKNLLHQQFLHFQEKESNLTKQFEKLLTQKELEINQLLSTIQNNSLQLKFIEEKEKMFQLENEKKNLLEEKNRSYLTSIQELNNAITLAQQENDNLKYLLNEKETSFQLFQEKSNKLQTEIERKNDELSKKVHHFEHLFQSLPSQSDLISFAEKIGYDFRSAEEKNNEEETNPSTSSPSSSSLINWRTMEVYLLDLYRKLNNESITHRLQEKEQNRKYHQLDQTYQSCLEKLKNAEIQIKLLENDIKLNQSSNSSSLKFHPSNKQHQQHSLANDLEMNLELNLTSNNNNSSSNSADPMASNANPSNKEEYLVVLQQQRNHYMKLTENSEREVNALKSSLQKIEEEKQQLTEDNMELYRRLRVLRVMNNNPNNPNNPSSSSAGGGSSQEMRSRRLLLNDADNNNSHDQHLQQQQQKDALDQKYHQLYENTDLNPYKILEFEKKQYVSSMNFLERMAVFLYHHIMKDPYLRNIFMIYLLIIHLITLSYLFQVLNPQLKDEVDQHLKNKWSAETFAKLDQHPDLE